MTATERAIRDNFPGPSNQGLRAYLRTLIDETGEVWGAEQTIALTAAGRASLEAIAATLTSQKGH